MKTLHLVLNRHWYDETAAGQKRIEYRALIATDEETGETRPSRWIKEIWEQRDAITHVRFARAYTKTMQTFSVTKIDRGPCPIPGWGAEYIRIHFAP